MRIIYSSASEIGGTGLAKVADHAVRALYRGGYLQKAVTYGNNQSFVPSSLIRVIWFQPAKIFSFFPARYYYALKRMWFDYVTAGIIGKKGCDIFHGWTLECLRSIQEAKKNNAITIVERGFCHPIYRKKILDEEYNNWGIKVPPGAGVFKRFDSLYRGITTALEEFELSDYVFVPSGFAKDTFIQYGFPENKIVMIPRGFDIDLYKPSETKKDSTFRVIFVGNLCIRKGVQYLLETWKRLNLKNAELLLVGSVHGEIKPILNRYTSMNNIRVTGFIRNPVDLYQEASLFVFPTLAEGSAKVTYEAMACGLPVVTTPNAGSLVSNGADGFIVPVRDKEALTEKILFFYNNPEAVREMGRLARKNIEPYTWGRYEKTLIDTYRNIWERR